MPMYRDSYSDDDPTEGSSAPEKLPAGTFKPFSTDGSHDVIGKPRRLSPRAHANLVQSLTTVAETVGAKAFMEFTLKYAVEKEALLRRDDPTNPLLDVLDRHRAEALLNGGRGLIPE